MFRGLIALLTVCIVVLTGLVAPAYAADNHVGGVSVGAKQTTDSHDIYVINTQPPRADSPSDLEIFLTSIKQGVIGTAGVAVGGAALCFAIDGAATTVFPPAAVLLPYCPGFGVALGGGKAVMGGVQAVTQGA